MREIKFRAWHKKKKILSSISELYVDGVYFDNFYKRGGTRGNSDVKYNDIILMQYTGLFDKNGVEIYEGDILKYTSPVNVDKVHPLHVVNWSIEQAKFIMDRTEGKDRSSNSVGLKNILKNRERWEITGNIYSNPDLIN